MTAGHELRPFKGSQGRGVGVQCSATSKQTGNRCRRFTGHAGLAVCRFHGGNRPVVRAAADRRLAALGQPALVALRDILENSSDNVARLRAAKYVIRQIGITPANLWIDDVEQLAIESGGVPQGVDNEIEALVRSLGDTQALENTGQETDNTPT